MPVLIDNRQVSVLIDSGSDFSILPPSICDPSRVLRSLPLPCILSANQQSLNVHGWYNATISIQTIKCSWKFLCADTIPILGSDFFAAHNLLIDCRSRKILPAQQHESYSQPTHLQSDQLTTRPQNFSVTDSSPNDTSHPLNLQSLLAEYQDLFRDSINPSIAIQHRVKHQIHTTERIVTSRPYRLPLGKIQEVKLIFDDLLSRGIITPSDSPYASPLVLVTKKDGSLRPCVDYRRLNEITIPDQYNIPRIEDLIQSIHGKWFSSLDLRSGYHQIPMDPKDAPKTFHMDG